MATGLTGDPIHQGSWFGLPDVGLTEKIGGLLGYGRDSQGGSNVSQPLVNYYNPNSTWNQNVQGSVLGAENSSQNYYNKLNGANTNAGTGGSTGNTGGTYVADGNVFNNPQDYEAYKAQQDYLNSYEGKQSSLINGQYDQYRNYLQGLVGELPTEQKQLEDVVGSQYDTQASDIAAGQKNAQTDLNRSRSQTEENKTSSFRDLEENLRNALFGAEQYLGVMGASNSSGAKQYAYALTKANNKQRAGIQKQANSTLADIAAREEKVNTTAQSEVQKLNKWKSEQLIGVSQFINSKKAEIQQRIANGEMDRSQALQQLNASVFPAAMQRLQQIDADVKGYKDTIMKFALDNMTNINAYKAQLGQLSGVSAPEFVAQQLQYAPQYAQSTDASLTGIAPSLFKKNQQLTV